MTYSSNSIHVQHVFMKANYRWDELLQWAKVNSLYFHFCNPNVTNMQLALACLYGNTKCVVCSAWRPGILHHGNISLPLFGLSTHHVIIYLRQECFRQQPVQPLQRCSLGVSLASPPGPAYTQVGKDGRFILRIHTDIIQHQRRRAGNCSPIIIISNIIWNVSRSDKVWHSTQVTIVTVHSCWLTMALNNWSHIYMCNMTVNRGKIYAPYLSDHLTARIF